jgi:uncharacterized SAM-binding protein YcdF (DUF218 family)
LLDLAFALKKIIAALIVPPGGFALGMVLGVIIALRRRTLGLSIVGLAVAAFFFATIPVIANRLQSSIETAIPPWKPEVKPKVEPISTSDPALPLSSGVPQRPGAIVIMGGGSVRGALEYGGETLKAQTLRRVRYGARLARQTGLPVLVTGGTPPDGKKGEAALMAESLREDFNVPVRWVEDRSKDTSENASYTIPILRKAGIDTAVLVTDITHMPRALREFESRGFRVIPAATNYHASTPHLVWTDFMPSISAFDTSCEVSHEWLGRIWQTLHAWP